MKPLIAILFACLSLPAQAEVVKIVHYNIKELNSVKLREGNSHKQLAAATRLISRLQPDLLSINEIQADLPGVPNSSFTTTGLNMDQLLSLSNLTGFSSVISAANTGLTAKPLPDGSYATNPNDPAVKTNVDPVNFGIFPMQYSTGAASRFPIVNKKVITDVKWKAFNPARNPVEFKDQFGLPLPHDVQLFDKSFTDLTLSIAGKEVHFILLHSVPAFDFGVAGSPNKVRNADQLSFLEWYLTGSTNFEVPKGIGIEPLPAGTLFIAVGDWNTDIVRNLDNPGTPVLKSLFSKTQLFKKDLDYTYESQPFAEKPYFNLLDYLVVSNGIKILDSGVLNPPADRKELGCNVPEPSVSNANRKVVKYYKKDAVCFVEVNADYAEIKTASDHRPIWATIEIN